MGSKEVPRGGDLLSALLGLLDRRVRLVCAEMLREHSAQTGCVRVKTAALMLDMCESRVRQLVRDGKLKVIHPTPYTIRIPLAEIRRYTEGKS